MRLRVLLLAVMLLMLTLALHHSRQTAYWLDEILSLIISGGSHWGPLSPADILQRVADDRAWPPLSNLLLAGWGLLVGWSEFAGRYLSALCGFLSVALMFVWGRDLEQRPRFKDMSGLACAVVLATSSFYLYYWQEMRGYTLALLLAILFMTLYGRLRQARQATTWQYIAFTLTLSALLYTHYIFSALAVAVGLYHLLTQRHHPLYSRVLLCFALGVLSLAPWAEMLLGAVVQETLFVRGQPLTVMLPELIAASGNGIPFLLAVGLLLALVALTGRSERFLWACLGLTLAGIVIYNQATGFFFHIRHGMVLLVPLYALIGRGIIHLANRQRRLALGLLTLWAGLGIFQSVTFSYFPQLTSHIQRLPIVMIAEAQSLDMRLADPDAPFVFYVGSVSDEWINEFALMPYFYTTERPYAFLGTMVNLRDSSLFGRDDEWDDLARFNERLQQLVGDSSSVWLFERDHLPDSTQRQAFLVYMKIHYPIQHTQTLAGFSLTEFRRE